MELIYISIALFAIAALIGIYLITFILQTRQPPKVAAVIHGLFAATAFVFLIAHMVNTGADIIQIIVIFALTALGGVVLFARHLLGKTLPKSLAVVHALLAITGFIYLLVYTFLK